MNIVGYFSCDLGETLSPRVGMEETPPGPLKSRGASSQRFLGFVTGCCAGG